MADIQSPTAEIRRGKKKERRTNDRMKICMACPIDNLYSPIVGSRAAIKRKNLTT